MHFTQNQCKSTALIQIECIHYHSFVKKKFFCLKSIKNQHRVSLSLLLFKKSTIIGTVLTFFAKYQYRYCRYGRYFSSTECPSLLMKVDYKKSVVSVTFMHIIVSFMKVGFESKSAHMLQIKSSLYSPYYAEAYNEWRGPSLPRSAWATQLRKNVAAVASHWRHCANLTGPGIEPQTFRTKSVRLATELKAGMLICS